MLYLVHVYWKIYIIYIFEILFCNDIFESLLKISLLKTLKDS